jgi:hypothetical protein
MIEGTTDAAVSADFIGLTDDAPFEVQEAANPGDGVIGI